jgi:4-amino-4-deoxy-L-arabinose transferase-like glycosyltransferase
MSNLTTWVKRHSETLGVLIVVLMGLGAGILLGLGFITVMSIVYSLHYGAC